MDVPSNSYFEGTSLFIEQKPPSATLPRRNGWTCLRNHSPAVPNCLSSLACAGKTLLDCALSHGGNKPVKTPKNQPEHHAKGRDPCNMDQHRLKTQISDIDKPVGVRVNKYATHQRVCGPRQRNHESRENRPGSDLPSWPQDQPNHHGRTYWPA